MIAFLSLRATRSLDRMIERWVHFADSPGVFTRELLGVVHLLETTRSPGSPWPTKRHPNGKRILLKKSYCHVYFDLDEANERIEILEIWDARRSHPPKL